MKLEKVGIVWHDYCKENKILKILLPLDLVLLFATGGLNLVSNFISLGSSVSAVIEFGFLLGVLLTFAKCNFKMLSFGIALFALNNLYSLVFVLIKYQSLSYYALWALLVYGFLAFLSYKKSLSVNS